MKKLLSLLAISAFSFCTASAQKFTLNGQLQLKEPVEKVFLAYRVADDRINDSADVTKKSFNISGSVTEPTMATLTIKYAQKAEEKRARTERFSIYLEPGTITVNAKDSLQLAKVNGSKAHTAYQAYIKLFDSFNAKLSDINKRFRMASEAKDEFEINKIRKEHSTLYDEKNENIVAAYVKNNPASPIVLYVLGQYAGSIIDLATVEPMFNNLSAANKNSASGVAFKERIESARKTMVGAMAMNFTQNDTLDKPVSLSDFKGKYVLIDFWASWCGPCRAENPNVVKAFHDYKGKGFTVLGVSLDQPGKKEAWINAIHKDELTWTQVSDLKGWDNEVSKQYGVRAIPQNFLVDPNGKIVAKNIRGEELNETLRKFLN